MPRVNFTPNLQRHVQCLPKTVEATTVREAVLAALTGNERAIGYILNDQGELRQHMVIFINGELVLDRKGLSDELPADAEIYVMQALSGG
jgi:molybdopterin synthase sulfur carrier subunit